MNLIRCNFGELVADLRAKKILRISKAVETGSTASFRATIIADIMKQRMRPFELVVYDI